MIHVLTHNLPPNTLANLVQALYNSQLLVPKGHYCVQHTLHTLWRNMQCIHSLKTCPKIIYKTMHQGTGSVVWRKQYLSATLMLLVERVYKYLACLQPNPLFCIKTGSLAYNPTFCHFYCFYQMGLIMHCPSRLRCTLFPAKITIYCRRVLNCHILLGCVEEELGRT